MAKNFALNPEQEVRLLKCMDEKLMSQRDAAALLGVHPATIRNVLYRLRQARDLAAVDAWFGGASSGKEKGA